MYAELRARLEGLVTALPLPPGATIGVAVLDAGGAEVFTSRADEPLLPASTEKLAVAASALRTFGPGHRFVTRVRVTAAVGPDGTLAGDLVLVGGGDPVLASPLFAGQIEPDRPSTPLAALADQVAAAGIRRVTGRLLGDGSAYADEPLPNGWVDEYLAELEGVRTGALTVDAGRALGVRDGRVVGDPEPDPALRAAIQLSGLLAERGVVVDGGFASTRTPPRTVLEVGRVESPPLAELLTYVVQRSDNQMADQIFRAVGARAGAPTWEGAARATSGVLDELGVDASAAVLADGSGLSRDNRVSARLLATLDLAMTSADPAWPPLQAVAGESGTLSRRLRGTVAEGRLRGKTGSLRDVRALAGAVEGRGGERYHLAVVGNGLDGPATAAVRDLSDALVLALAEDLYDCVPVPLPPPVAGSPPPAPQLECAA